MIGKKMLAPGIAIAISLMMLAMSAAPVIADGAKYQVALDGKAKLQKSQGNTWVPASVSLVYAELPAMATLTVGGVPYQKEILTIQYAFIPDGVQGVNIGTMWINFTQGSDPTPSSISGTIESGWKTYNEPSSYMYFEVVGLGGKVYLDSTPYIFAGMDGTVEISNSGSVIPPE